MTVEAVQATTADGFTLRGERVRGGDTWVVLVHDLGEDIDAWQPIRPGLVKSGWTVLALDLRGHGGSDGPDPWVPERAELDVDLGVTLARRCGARHVSVLAAGYGAVLALRALERAREEEAFELPDSLILFSPGPLDGADPMGLRGCGLSRLMLYGAADPDRDDALALQRSAIGWQVAISFPTSARGTALAAERRVNVLDKIGGFLREQATLRGPGLARAEGRHQAETI